MFAYKLFRKMKNGDIKSLFINKTKKIEENVWLKSESFPTPGFKVRPGWHVTLQPIAPHLSEKNRVWRKVEISNFIEIKRPESQGGVWLLADNMKVLPNE